MVLSLNFLKAGMLLTQPFEEVLGDKSLNTSLSKVESASADEELKRTN